MIFLIEYIRKEGKIFSKKEFQDHERHIAEKERLEMEISLLRKGLDHEVVLLEAKNENALRRTHRRYFENLAGLLAHAGG